MRSVREKSVSQRLLSLMLSLSLVFGILPATAFAVEDSAAQANPGSTSAVTNLITDENDTNQGQGSMTGLTEAETSEKKEVSLQSGVVEPFTLMGDGTGELPASETPVDELTTENTIWQYLDTNVDPGTAGDAKAWTKAGYDSSAWKTAKGSFGAKNGVIKDGAHNGYTAKTLLQQYQDGEGQPNTPAFFFRAGFDLSDATDVSALSGKLLYDDGVIVYINGVKVQGFNDENITGNMSYNNGKSESDAATGTFSVAGEALTALKLQKTGNVLAVELHNDGADSSDVFLDFAQLKANYPGKATFSNIIMNIGADETERYVTWFSDSTETDKLQLAFASAPDVFSDVTATKTASKYVSGFSYYHCEITGIVPNTGYLYRVGNETEGWSETYSFTSGSGDGAFSFLLAGDPQLGSSGKLGKDAEGWVETMNKATEWFPDVEFLISAGDQVENKATEEQFTAFTRPEQLKSLPVAVNVGNHDSGLDSYSEHFIVPNADNTTVTGTGVSGGDYWYTYNGVLFLSINSNDRSTAKHKAFLVSAIADYKTANDGKEPKWKIVTFHHSVYSTASHESDGDIIDRRNELPLVFSELGIDAVLMGHDHVYARTFMMSGTQPTTDVVSGAVTDPGYGQVLYLTANSASGSKFYAIHNKKFPYAAVTNQENVPNITKIDVSDGALTFNTYRTGADNTIENVVDTFTIHRTKDKPQDSVTEQKLVSTADTTWKYLDNNVNPGKDANSKEWAAADFQDSAWKSGKGAFGAKNGAIAEHEGRTPTTLLQQYQDGAAEPDIPAYFFRTTFDVTNPEQVTSLKGSLFYDDAAVVYINGVRVAGFNDGKLTENMSFSDMQTISNADAGTFMVGGAVLQSVGLRATENVLAVELHNVNDHSSDIFLEMESLAAYTDSSADELAPILTVPTETVIHKGDAFDPMEGVSAQDLHDGDLTASIQVSGTVNTEKAGAYTLTYTVSDLAGHIVSVKRTVSVKDVQTLLTSGETDWKYREDNVDPAAGSEDRTSWTAPAYDDSGAVWKTGKGAFGAKDGAISDLGGGCVPDVLLAQYINGTGKPDIPAYFFRSTFALENAGEVETLSGSLVYDDGVIVYINGVRAAAFDDKACDDGGTGLGHGFDANLQYGGSNSGDPKPVSFSLTGETLTALGLKNGENTIAVELHNGRASSSDIYLDFTSLQAEKKVSEEQKPSGGGSSSGSSRPSGTTTTPAGTTTTGTDGSTTVTKTDTVAGTTTAVTTWTDGSKQTVVTKKDGSSFAELSRADGVKSKIDTTSDGKSSASVTLPSGTKQTVVKLPVPDASLGTVPVLVKADGTRKVIKDSLAMDGTVSVVLDGSVELAFEDRSKSFADVPAGNWASDAVAFVTSHDLFQGTAADTFSPNDPMSRAMLVAVLYRMEDEPAAGANTFGDVPAGTWYTDAVSWASGRQLVNGTGTGFAPNDDMTRQELATVIYRYAQSAGLDMTVTKSLDGFPDSASISNWASEAMAWAYGAGILTGGSDGRLDPDGNATRSQTAAIFQRLTALQIK